MKKTAAQLVAEASEEIVTLTPADALKMQQDGEAVLVDIRDIRELAKSGRVPDAVHAPRGMLEFWADPESPYYRDYFQEDRRIVVFCAAGGRSALAALALQEMGFPDVAHLEPGFAGWENANKTVEDVSTTSRWIRREKL